jgi:hypothetical protein
MYDNPHSALVFLEMDNFYKGINYSPNNYQIT